jgi:hypothetical protein
LSQEPKNGSGIKVKEKTTHFLPQSDFLMLTRDHSPPFKQKIAKTPSFL